MVDYEMEIQKLKDGNQIMKLKALSEPPQASSSELSMPAGAAGDKAGKQVQDLQALVQKRDQELVKQKERETRSTKDKQALNNKFTEMEKQYTAEKAKVVKYVREKDDALTALRNARQ